MSDHAERDNRDNRGDFADLPAADPGERREGFPPVAVVIPAGEAPARLIHLPTTLPETKAAIGGGWLELVDGGPIDDTGRAVLWCDEEGKLKGLPVNARATLAATYLIGGAGFDPRADVLVGDVLITGVGDDGETAGIPAHALLALRSDRTLATWVDERYDPPRVLPAWTPSDPVIGPEVTP